jgi:outer membrane protein OmpA-like peptidoglycan-associated protein
MKKFVLFLILLFSITKSNSQSYIGYFADNYAGVQGVLFNPASIVDSRFKTDINLVSISGSLNNDFYGLSLFDLSKKSYDVNKNGVYTPTRNNGGILFADLMGPSFMFNIAPKHSIAVFTRARAVLNINDANGDLYNQLKDGLDSASNFNIAVGSPNVVGHTWGEIGMTYAAVLWQNKQNFLKGGFTAKYLVGGVNSYGRGTNLTANFIKTNNPLTSVLTTTGGLTIGSSQDFITGNQNVNFDANSKGYGADFGLIYEWRPDYESYDLAKAKAADNNFKNLNKYKLRFGLSITDIGSIKYKDAKEEVYNFNNTLTQAKIESAVDLTEILDFYTTPVTTFKDINIKLPTVMHLDVDWNMYKKFYLNLNGNLSLVENSNLNQTSSANTYILTPRYETKWFTFSLPINYMEYSGMQLGTGLRLGPIFVGSSSLITNVLSKESKATDVYFGLKIPIYNNKFKDTDQDDVLDKKDSCPKVAGAIKNKGCPWPDSDSDSVLDNDDKCPKIAGPVENQGCPWPDSDSDSVLDKDDTCPKVAGPAENKGCPWQDTDGDSVLDNDDKCPTEKGLVENAGCPEQDADKDGVEDKTDDCPTVAGPVSNKGCPEVTAAVLQELKIQARSVYFVTGKAVLKTADKGETDGRLVAIKEILKNYPNAKFSIEGHTDSVGDEKSNQKLSQARARVVMNALVAKGVNPANLTYKGYGESKPVASNKTAKGRTENRRTEVIHIGSKYEGKL